MTIMLSKPQLAEVLLVKLKLRHPEYEFELNTNSLQDHALVQIHVLRNEQKIFSCSIDKLYLSYQNKPQDLDMLCAPLLAMVKEFLSGNKDEKMILLPKVITHNRLEQIQNNYRQEQQTLVNTQNSKILSIPFIENLVVTIVLDGADRLSYLSVGQLKKLHPNQNIQEIYALAISNLSSLLPQLKIEKSALFEATLRLDYNYELSMLLIFDQWKHRLPFSSSPVIAIAAHDAVIFADSTQPRQIEALHKIILNMQDFSDPPLVARLLTINDNTIKLLEDLP